MRQELATAAEPLVIESLDHEGRGVGHVDGKVVFVEGGLAGECVTYAVRRSKSSYAIGEVVDVLKASAARVVPRCPHFGVCGGCSMQHLDATAQVAVKQRVLEDNLIHIGRVRAERMLAPIHGSPWHYRYRARLSVRVVDKKGGALVGFHEKRSSYVADMRECHVLPAAMSALLVPLRSLIESLSIARRVPQIEGGDWRRRRSPRVAHDPRLPPSRAVHDARRRVSGRVRSSAWRLGVAAIERAGHDSSARSVGAARTRVLDPRVRRAHDVSPPPTSRRSTPGSIACSCIAPCACSN